MIKDTKVIVIKSFLMIGDVNKREQEWSAADGGKTKEAPFMKSALLY